VIENNDRGRPTTSRRASQGVPAIYTITRPDRVLTAARILTSSRVSHRGWRQDLLKSNSKGLRRSFDLSLSTFQCCLVSLFMPEPHGVSRKTVYQSNRRVICAFSFRHTACSASSAKSSPSANGFMRYRGGLGRRASLCASPFATWNSAPPPLATSVAYVSMRRS